MKIISFSPSFLYFPFSPGLHLVFSSHLRVEFYFISRPLGLLSGSSPLFLIFAYYHDLKSEDFKSLYPISSFMKPTLSSFLSHLASPPSIRSISSQQSRPLIHHPPLSLSLFLANVVEDDQGPSKVVDPQPLLARLPGQTHAQQTRLENAGDRVGNPGFPRPNQTKRCQLRSTSERGGARWKGKGGGERKTH